ncbi:MAG TPA: PDZ domain-containing protein [Phycisphaerae bacterium]|nr:PDZ domain-containing protein [Phycisphaerae bacterium]
MKRIKRRSGTTFGVLVSSMLVLLAGCQGESGRPTSAAAQAKATAPQAQVLAEFLISVDGSPITVLVQIDGKEYLFMVDTGCTYTVLDTSLASHLGDRVGSKITGTSTGNVVMDLFSPVDVRLEGLDFRECGPMMKADLSRFREIYGLNIRGLVGMSFLGRYVVQFDFDRARLRLWKSDSARHPEWGNDISLKPLSNGEPTVRVRLGDDYDDFFSVDTGDNSDVRVPGAIFHQIIRKNQLASAKTLFSTLLGESWTLEARLTALSVGDCACNGLILGQGQYALLGLGWLRRHQAIFDFPACRLYLSVRREFTEPSESDMSGLHLLRMTEGTIAKYIDKPSPAEAAGVRPEDLVITVNGKPAASYSMQALRALLSSGDGKRIAMTIRRDGKDLSVEFTLKRRI